MTAAGSGPGDDAGSGARVVLVPGLGLQEGSWAAVRAALDGQAHVVALPGMGRSAAAGEDLSVPAQAERLVRELDDGPRVVLAGHSASCAVVVAAAHRSRRVAGLLLVAPATDPRAATWPRLAWRWLRTAPHETAWQVPGLVRQYRRTGLPTLLRTMDVVRRYRTDRGLAGLDMPVVVLRGSRDRIAPRDWQRELAGGRRRRRVEVPGAAHMVPLTHPGAVARAVRQVRADAG